MNPHSSPDLSAPHPAVAAQAADNSALVGYVLALADDALVAAQRMGEWVASAPQLEEDVALANIGLDLLGQARSLLTYAGQVEDAGRDEDDLAYQRDERDFRNVHLVERGWGEPGPDFGVAIARLLVFSSYQHELYDRLRAGADETLAAIAAKAVKEVHYHRDHAASWTVRLGDGTEESHARMQAAMEAEWRYVDELFDASYVDPGLLERGVAVDPAALRDPWQRYVEEVLTQATLTLPDVRPAVTGGRRGIHSEQMGYLLAEMQHLARSHPGASW